MKKTPRIIFLIASIAVCVVFVLFAALVLPDAAAKLLLNNTKDSSFPFTIQVIMWIMFFVGIGELAYRVSIMRQQKQALGKGFLPEDERRVLTVDNMSEIYQKVKSDRTELASLISGLALRFQAGKSVEQTHQLLSSQLELWQYRLDLDYTLVRYITWLVPTIGFIGTVVGISHALTFAGSGAIDPESPEFLPAITSQLGLAFDTTLIALVMSVVLVFLMNWIQEREERLVESTGRYCLDNLITRLYVA